MGNVFVAAAIKAMFLRELAKKAAVMCFNLGMQPRDAEVVYEGDPHNKNSKRCVAQDKRDARKARNRLKARRG